MQSQLLHDFNKGLRCILVVRYTYVHLPRLSYIWLLPRFPLHITYDHTLTQRAHPYSVDRPGCGCTQAPGGALATAAVPSPHRSPSHRIRAHAPVENSAGVAADSIAAAMSAPRGLFIVAAVQACRFGSPDIGIGIGESAGAEGVSTGEATGEGRIVPGVADFVALPISALPAIGTNLLGKRLDE